jgi:hypothetical protein
LSRGTRLGRLTLTLVPHLRFLPCVLALSVCGAEATRSHAREAPRAPVVVTVRAQPRFEISKRSTGRAELELRVRLVDDASVALPGVNVEMELESSAAGFELEPCSPGALRRARPSTTATTDASGVFCVRAAGFGPKDSVLFRFKGDALHLPAREQVALHGSSEGPLRFELTSLEFQLDQPRHEVRLLEAAPAPAPEIPPIDVHLHAGGQHWQLETSDWSRHNGALVFSVRSEQLGSPGPARLTAQPAGADGAMSRAEAIALRIATVRLSARLDSMDSDLAEVSVSAVSAGGPPTSGWVEADSGGRVLGRAPLVNGAGRMSIRMPSGRSGVLSFSYHPDDSWWQPGEPFELALGPVEPDGPARWPWLVVLIAIGYVCLRALQRPAPKRSPARRSAPKEIPELRTAPSRTASGWSGTVIDAHDGRSIAGARVEVSLPSFRESASDATAVTDASGRFAIPTLTAGEGAMIRVTAPLHTEVHRPLPPQGRVDIALSSRRRALLRRLVRWARSSGPPWHGQHEPTPGEVASVAVRRGDHPVARWAERVGEVAFGAAAVDEIREAELHALEPGRRQPRGPRTEEPED